jgi:anti-sigma-K factor RskA
VWQGWSLTATAATALLATILWWQSPALQSTPPEQWLAVVQSPQAEPLWVVDADASATAVRLKPVAAPAIDAQKDYELWLLPQQGAPQSIGILPTGEVEVTIRLSAEQFKALLQNQSLAISIEPKGGSPTGLPTGPVVYQSKLLKI